MTTPHLDDEALSAALDGAASAAAVAHLASCPQCGTQMASLAAVARAVGAPIPPRPSREVDDAIGRALAVWPTDAFDDMAQATGTARGYMDGDRGSIEPVAVAPATAGAAPTAGGAEQSTGWSGPVTSGPVTRSPVRAAPRPGGRRGGAGTRWLGAAAGIAAAVVVAAGLAAILRGGSHRSASTSSVAAGASTTAGALTNQAPAAASVGDLGDQSDPVALARLVAGSLASPSAGAAAVPAPRVITTTVPGAGIACADQARAAVGSGARGDAPVFSAPLRWRGQPAVVVVFSRPGGLAGAVMKTNDCSVLAVLPF